MNFLTISNGRVVDGAGRPVWLRGVNIGGWLTMEHFLTGHPGAEASLRRTMAQHLGPQKAAFFFDRLLAHFFNADDVAFLRAQGLTAIRLPLNYRHFESDEEPGVWLEGGFARLDAILEACERAGLYVILDLHAAQGWQNGDWHCDNSSRHALLWHLRDAQDRFVALWGEIARRYANRAVVAAWDLVNEPLTNAPYGRFAPDGDYVPAWPRLNGLYARTLEAIRAVDARHIIVLEGDYYSTLFSGMDAPADALIMASNHNYIEPAIAPITEFPIALDGVRWDAASIEAQYRASEGYRWAQEHNRPLLVGEFGLSMDYPAPNVPVKVAVLAEQMACYNRLDCHWTFWAYKGLGSMAWVQTNPDSAYNRTIAPVLAAKQALGVDFGWLGGFPEPVQTHMQGLSNAVARHMPGLNPHTNFRYLAQAAMSTYTADQLQNLYAAQFARCTETQIDEILASFALRHCIERVEMSRAISAAAQAA